MRSQFFLLVPPACLLFVLTAAAQDTTAASSSACIDCHAKVTPKVVPQWKQSKHAQKDVGCVACHGADHTSATDVGQVKIARPEVCASCHKSQVDQYRSGKHSHALAAMKTQPNTHWRDTAQATGQTGCAQCHRVGSPNVSNELRQEKFGGIESGALQWGAGACDSCHSRHTFSLEEARQPQACQTCHTGLDNDQWEMYSSSRHGALYSLKQGNFLPGEKAAPSCQTCHMAGGDHSVHTAWGYWGVILPAPDDPQWAADRTLIMKALNMLSPQGEKTNLIETLKSNQGIRFTQAEWQQERDSMLKTCSQCHSADFAQQQLKAGDDTLRAADHLLAEAIRVLAALYQDGILQKGNQPYAFPWLTSFDPPATPIEQKLQTMYHLHRSRAFHGAFHNSPKYEIEYGLRPMQQDLVEIKTLSEQMRRDRKPGAKPAKTTPAAAPRHQ